MSALLDMRPPRGTITRAHPRPARVPVARFLARRGSLAVGSRGETYRIVGGPGLAGNKAGPPAGAGPGPARQRRPLAPPRSPDHGSGRPGRPLALDRPPDGLRPHGRPLPPGRTAPRALHRRGAAPGPRPTPSRRALAQ